MHAFGFPAEQSGLESNDPSSAVTLWTWSPSRCVQVTSSPTLTVSSLGVNWCCWIDTLRPPPAAPLPGATSTIAPQASPATTLPIPSPSFFLEGTNRNYRLICPQAPLVSRRLCIPHWVVA